jgi:hypothetical protein
VAIPAELTHWTTATGAAGIAQSGRIFAGTGFQLWGRGIYATTIEAALNPFVPAGSIIPVIVDGSNFFRIIPGYVYLNGGNWLTVAWAAAPTAAAAGFGGGGPSCSCR